MDYCFPRGSEALKDSGVSVYVSGSGGVRVYLATYDELGNLYGPPEPVASDISQAWGSLAVSGVQPSIVADYYNGLGGSPGVMVVRVDLPPGYHLVTAEFYTPLTGWIVAPTLQVVDNGVYIAAELGEGLAQVSGDTYRFTAGNLHRVTLLVEGPGELVLRVSPGESTLTDGYSLVALTYLIVQRVPSEYLNGIESNLKGGSPAAFLYAYNATPVGNVVYTLIDATAGRVVAQVTPGAWPEALLYVLKKGEPIDSDAPWGHRYILYVEGVKS